ncbi:MAG: GC-type dockerin domain-anchored protein [Phycisphaerales bacterium]
MRGLVVVSAAVLLAGAARGQQRYALYVFDQTGDKILRLLDLNGDGDAHDAGEVTRFYDDTPGAVLGIDNSQGLLALGFDDLLATDNFEPDNIVRITDTNGDGDGFDAGEAAVVFSGALPGGFTLSNPAELIRQNPTQGDGLVLLSNNTLDDTLPEAVYTLTDLNGDGDYDDAGEVVENAILSPVGDSFAASFLGIAQDNAGFCYGIDIATPDSDPSNVESIDRINMVTGAVNEWITNTATFTNLGLFISGGLETAHYAPTDEILAELVDFNFNGFLYAFRDVNGSGVIDAFNETRLLWSEAGNADGVTGGSMRDIVPAPDGSIFIVDALRDTVRRLTDLNGDGDFQDAGETTIVYDAAIAAANGGEALSSPLTIAVAALPPCEADLNGNGVLDPGDFTAWVVAFNAGDIAADQNGNGVLDPGDFTAWVSNYNAGCI